VPEVNNRYVFHAIVIPLLMWYYYLERIFSQWSVINNMGKYFNVTGACFPDLHYMVNLDNRIAEIRKMIGRNDYFVINRGRQYGKTTTLMSLAKALSDEYVVFLVSFQEPGEEVFESEAAFCRMVCDVLCYKLKHDKSSLLTPAVKEQIFGLLETIVKESTIFRLSRIFTELCHIAEKPVILLIDEVDQAGNFKVFLQFLGMLRQKYLDRHMYLTFKSVILAGVYDIKNLKLKIRKEDEHHYFSPWNIAADFKVDMSLSTDDIISMLKEYEEDYQTGMNICNIASLIFEYTSGYPYFVSRICKIIDEDISGIEQFPDKNAAWTNEGFHEAVRLLLLESNLLYDDMVKKLYDYPELYKMLHNILFQDQKYSYDISSYAINLCHMFGYIKRAENRNAITIANRIFEMKLNMFFLSEAEFKNSNELVNINNLNQFTKDGYLNMDLVMEKFFDYYTEVYRDSDQAFLEKNGCKLFLMHLKQIINGTGNYYREAQTFDNTRMDIVVDYLSKQSIIELKVWRGGLYHEEGESQLERYLDLHKLDIGYMLIFNFNKNKEVGIKRVVRNGKTIVETTV